MVGATPSGALFSRCGLVYIQKNSKFAGSKLCLDRESRELTAPIYILILRQMLLGIILKIFATNLSKVDV